MRQTRLCILTILLLFLAAQPVEAQQMQKFHVESFGENSFDMSAREKPTSRDDGTGTLYAIIKVRSTAPEDDLNAYDLDFDYLKDVQEMHDGVLWVYVQYGAKTVTIKRDGFYTVERYNLKTTLQPGKVYDMTIKPEPKVVSMQYLIFEISPADSEATVMYTDLSKNDGEKKLGDVDSEGCVAKMLVLGRYAYRIISENYHSSEGVVTLDTPNDTHTERVTLRPNFARVTLSVGGGSSVDIYINKEKKGTGSWRGNLAPGTYSIECRKPNHRTTTETITVADGADVTHTLKAPEPITGALNITSTPLRAAISIDGKPCGETPRIISDLLIGTHKVTLSKSGYESAIMDVVVKEKETTEHNVTLKKITTGSTTAAKPKQSAPKRGKITFAPYKVGDYYNDGTNEGVVFAVSKDGSRGKILSLGDYRCKWSLNKNATDAISKKNGVFNMSKITSLPNWKRDYPAFAGCASQGEGWYLPAIDEVKLMVARREAIDETLKKLKATTLEAGFYYISSTEFSDALGKAKSESATGLYVKSNETSGRAKVVGDHKARAVYAFGSAAANLSVSRGEKTSPPYKVGDYFNDGIREGIVFEVNKDSLSGKIMSIERSECQLMVKEESSSGISESDGAVVMYAIRSLLNWEQNFPAFAWCASLGRGWYLPSSKELNAISSVLSAVDRAMVACGGDILSDEVCWSSSKPYGSNVYCVIMPDGKEVECNSVIKQTVRAVSVFKAKRKPETFAPYKVGDYYNDGKKEGIVFQVSNGGYCGKIVSLEKQYSRWSNSYESCDNGGDGVAVMAKVRSLPNWELDYPVFAWCASLGDEWYLPTRNELWEIFSQNSKVEDGLKALGLETFPNDDYWSSEDSYISVWCMRSDGSERYTNKSNQNSALAVSAFKEAGNVVRAVTSAPYKVGDYYNDGKKEGVVFEVGKDGCSGKIMSLGETVCRWGEKEVKTGASSKKDGAGNLSTISSLPNWKVDCPAFAWCASLGDGWYLPAYNELNAIYAASAAINATLESIGETVLCGFANYWSSSEAKATLARVVMMSSGKAFSNHKHYRYNVRAVSAF